MLPTSEPALYQHGRERGNGFAPFGNQGLFRGEKGAVYGCDDPQHGRRELCVYRVPGQETARLAEAGWCPGNVKNYKLR